MRKAKLLMALIGLFVTSYALISCKDNGNEDDQTKNVKFAVALDMPLNINEPSLTGATATLTNVQTKMTYTATNFRKAVHSMWILQRFRQEYIL